MKIWRRIMGCLAAAGMLSWVGTSFAAEHPGTSVEHPGKAVQKKGPAITADFVKDEIKRHVEAEAKKNKGAFVIDDPELKKTWTLNLVTIHDPVRQFEKDGKTIYFTCSDFKSVDSDDVLDIDFWMVPEGNGLKVIDTKIHKINGKPRYTYEGVEIKELK